MHAHVLLSKTQLLLHLIILVILCFVHHAHGLLDEAFEFTLFPLGVHLCAHVFDDPGLFSPLNDGVAEFAEEQITIDYGEVVRELRVDVLDAAVGAGHAGCCCSSHRRCINNLLQSSPAVLC